MISRAPLWIWHRRCLLAGLAAITWAVAHTAFAQQPTASVEIPAGIQPLLSKARPPNLALDTYLQNLRWHFFELDADADGRITMLDADRHTRMESIQLRTLVMRLDLDGDGAVTEDEIRRGLKYEMRTALGLTTFNFPDRESVVGMQRLQQQVDKIVLSMMALDADKDGKVSYSEAGALDRYDAPRQLSSSGQSRLVRQVLALDAEAKGSVDLDEFQAAGEALFRKIDTDGNGLLSQPELNDYSKRPEMPDADARHAALGAVQKRSELARAACHMPVPSPKAKVILLGAYSTQALSSVAIGSQDSVVHAGRIAVEPGDDPLYVVATTYSAMIWQFSGAVDRVERLVMISAATGPKASDGKQPSLVAATGLPREKIVFLAKSNCLGAYSGVGSGQSEPAAAVRDATGREADGAFWGNSVRGFSIPSGQVESLSSVRKPEVSREAADAPSIEGDFSKIIRRASPGRALTMLHDSAPGGLIEIDPKSVIANLPVQTYETFPQEAGLLQLLDSGALKQNTAGDYVVQRKMRFPPGLHGGHLVKFLVPRGIPVPDGDPGHSCVQVEDTGAKKGVGCR